MLAVMILRAKLDSELSLLHAEGVHALSHFLTEFFRSLLTAFM